MEIKTTIYSYNPFEESYEDAEVVSVDVPLEKICDILGKQFGITGEQMLNIIIYFDIELDDKLENNEDIQWLARELYFKERD